MVIRERPELQSLFQEYSHAENLFDFREPLALARAFVDVYLLRGNPTELEAVRALSEVVRLGKEVAGIEARLGPITHADLERWGNAYSATLARFVPDDRLEDAISFLSQLMGFASGDG